MAQLGLAGVIAALNLVQTQAAVAQFRRDCVLLNLLSVKADRNSSNVWTPVFTGNRAAAPNTPGSTMSSGEFGSETRVQATNAWANYRTGVDIADETLDIVAASGGAEGTDLVRTEVSRAIELLSQELGADMYAGSAAASPVELDGAARVIDSTGTVCGIAPGDQAEWAATENGLAAGSLSKSKLRSLLFRGVKNATGRDPRFVTCDGTLMDLVKDVFEDSAETVNEVMTARGTVDIYKAAGARAVILDGVPFIEDRHATTGYFYAWSDYVDLRYVPAAAPTETPAELATYVSAITGRTISDNDIEARLKQIGNSWRPILWHQGKDGTATKLGVRSGNVQLRWHRRNAFSKLQITGL